MDDRGLIPANTTLEILARWKELRERFDFDTTLYEEFKKYFSYLDTGRKETSSTK